MGTTRSELKSDDGVQSMVRLYAVIEDWYANVTQAKRGVRTCERLVNIRDRGLVPLAQRYFEHVAEVNGLEFSGDAGELLQEWADEFRPSYVEESESHDFGEYDSGLTRVLLDEESRLGRFAVDSSVSVNSLTVAASEDDSISDELEEELEEIWYDWARRLDDLYWERRMRISKNIVIGKGEGVGDFWLECRLDAYPEFPSGVVIGGEERY